MDHGPSSIFSSPTPELEPSSKEREQERRVLEALATADAPANVGRDRAARICRDAGIRIGNVTLARIIRQRRQTEQAFGLSAAEILGTTEPIENPLLALQELAGEVIAFKDLVRNRLGFLRESYTHDDKGNEQTRADIQLYERALDRAERVLSSIARLNLDERIAQIETWQAEVIIAVLTGVLSTLGVDHDNEQVGRALHEQLSRFGTPGRVALPASGVVDTIDPEG